MSGQQADGVYNRRAWSAPTADAPKPPQEYIGPFQSNQERLLSQSLATWNMTAAEVQEYVRPPLPQVKLFPSRYGFTEYELTIEDIVQMPRRGQQRVESDFSQTPNTTQSSSRNTLGNA
ncbi:hypothetical protein UFOVP696_78 [uncultured Caudovirales phage]|jgi:hypothetical protein|uniref:Uncharacterized protein n=1 Tax=uncultured Caudovirales phage TaxID=2100421 RepID=A0A6J5NES0_9CAUD|nr:hypothetical protein UFOVP429_89 [uncultured Caudovirales phage]CAB4158210.1 hypothetical protein UFOVP696_78 [uncultured Caudovirales phage]